MAFKLTFNKIHSSFIGSTVREIILAEPLGYQMNKISHKAFWWMWQYDKA